MNIQILFPTLALSVLVGCNDAAQLAVPESPQVAESSPSQSLEEFMANLGTYRKHGQFPPNCEVTTTGSLECDGDLLPNPDAPPEGWEPFEFGGQTYYFVPLAKSDE